MGLRKRHVKKRNSGVHSSGLFGIMDKAESTKQMRKSEVSFAVALNYKERKSVRDAMLEAKYRKAQAITLTRQMHYM